MPVRTHNTRHTPIKIKTSTPAAPNPPIISSGSALALPHDDPSANSAEDTVTESEKEDEEVEDEETNDDDDERTDEETDSEELDEQDEDNDNDDEEEEDLTTAQGRRRFKSRGETLLELPSLGLRGSKTLTEAQILKRQEKARKRKIQVENQTEEAKRATVAKLLQKQNNKQIKEKNLKKRRRDEAIREAKEAVQLLMNPYQPCIILSHSLSLVRFL